MRICQISGRFFQCRLAVFAAKILCWVFIPLQTCLRSLIVYNICYIFQSNITYVQCMYVSCPCVWCLCRAHSHRPVIAVKQTQSMVFESSPGTSRHLDGLSAVIQVTMAPPLREWTDVHEKWMDTSPGVVLASLLFEDPTGSVDTHGI